MILERVGCGIASFMVAVVVDMVTSYFCSCSFEFVVVGFIFVGVPGVVVVCRTCCVLFVVVEVDADS